MTTSPLRSEKLYLRLTPGAKQTLQRAAAAAQRSLTDFVLESSLASAAETLADRQSFQLDAGRWEAFVAALDAPPQVHPRLARLLQEPSVVELSVVEAPPAGGTGWAGTGSNRSRPTMPWRPLIVATKP
jgi:uncharacterized protein (DUF1778 family)